MTNSNFQKKKIWILNHHATPPDVGTGTRHFDFAIELINRGYDVTIFSSSRIHYTNVNVLEEGEKFRVADIDGIYWVYIDTHEYIDNSIDRIISMFDYYFKVLKLSKRFKGPDIVIGSAVHLLACLAAYRISKRYKIRFISEIRDLWPETLIQMGRLKRSSFTAKLMNLLEDYIYRKADRIITTAPGMGDYIRSRGINDSKITYINNGINVRDFDNRCERQYPEDFVGLNKQYFNVVYAGGIGIANDVITAVRAAEIIQKCGYADIKFSIFGDGPLKQELISAVHNLGLSNIEFYGYFPRYCIPKVLCNSDVLIFMGKKIELYKYGISANKLFEYLCSGKPIIFGMETINNYIEELGCGISIEPESPKDMAGAILKIYNMSEQERMDMGAKGRNFVEMNFDIPILVDTLEEVLNL